MKTIAMKTIHIINYYYLGSCIWIVFFFPKTKPVTIFTAFRSRASHSMLVQQKFDAIFLYRKTQTGKTKTGQTSWLEKHEILNRYFKKERETRWKLFYATLVVLLPVFIFLVLYSFFVFYILLHDLKENFITNNTISSKLCIELFYI